MRERDEELEKWLASLRRLEPSTGAVERWQQAVAAEQRRGSRYGAGWLRRPAQLAAAVALGYLIGVTSAREWSHPPEAASEANATVQYLYDKTE